MRRVLPCLVLTATVACQDYDFMFRPNQRIAITTVREVVIANTDTDILFVVDNSGSMKEEQVNLQRNTAAFITELAQSENAYRVGVITTDVFGSNDSGRLRMVRATSGVLTAAGCNIGPDTSGKLWLERSNAPVDSQQFEDESCRLIEDFKATIESLEPIDEPPQDGCFVFADDTIGDGREAGLKAAALTARDATAINYNKFGDEDFIREDADLALIFLTDESDCSFDTYPPESATTNAWCYDQINAARDVEDYVRDFANLKPRGAERKVRAALIGGGVFLGADVEEFVPRGCRLDTSNNQASDDCGCWSSTSNDFPCELLHNLGHPCPGGDSCFQTGACDNEFLNCASTAGASCDTPRCEAMPALRYHEFVDALGDARVAFGFPRGTFEDSICKPEYDDTLRQIARTVVLSTCFPLEDEVLSSDQVKMVVRVTTDEACSVDSQCTEPNARCRNDFCVNERLVPEIGGSNGCMSCTGECANGAWRLQSPTEICLECDLKKEPGTDFVLTILNEIIGFDGAGGGDP